MSILNSNVYLVLINRSSPMKGIVKTTTAIPQGIYKIVIGTHEGFVNLPTLYGSEVRKSGQVKGIASGIKEAGKVC